MKKTIFTIIVVIALLVVFAIAAIALLNAYIKNSVSHSIMDSAETLTQKYDCIVVLGCGVYEDGTPSPMLSDRLRRAVELYKSGASQKLLMSGDHGTKEYDEVNAMRDYAIEHGVPAKNIFMDHAGFSTYDSVYRAKEIFCADKIVVVTQKYHLYRALYIAKALGIDAAGMSADYRQYASQTILDMREVAARCKDFFKCIAKPEPTYLGEPIPVSGDGSITAG